MRKDGRRAGAEGERGLGWKTAEHGQTGKKRRGDEAKGGVVEFFLVNNVS